MSESKQGLPKKVNKSFRNDKLEYEFLPAALEIIETPPSPLGRFNIWLIFGLIMAAILWSCVSKVDEVAVARGKIIPDGRLKVVQPSEEGIVTAIHVGEGQHVKEGELLVELDSTMKKVDLNALRKSLNISRIEKEMLNATLSGGNAEDILKKENISESEVSREVLAFLKQQKAADELQQATKISTLNSTIAQKNDAVRSARSELTRLQTRSNQIRNDISLKRELYENGTGTKRDLEDSENQLALAEQEYETQRIQLQQAENSVEEAIRSRATIASEGSKDILDRIVEKEKAISEIEAQLEKAEKSVALQQLYSPVEGAIHGLATNTIGGVVTPAQAIMTLVPDGTPLVVEANVTNSDIGFIKIGQIAEVKLDTFPFQRYGTIKGTVLSISPDAFDDEKLGSVYKMKVELEKTKMFVDGSYINVSPGMTVSAEIKTGKRRVIEFFLSPIIKYSKESLQIR